MKKVILTSLFLSIFYFSNAQDTTVVQTLTWADDFRASVYDFPDIPQGGWEKVLMMYNMRCHDAAVGNGNVGCREWDFSCNTFITDSSRVDSTRLVHLTHIISNFDNQAGNTFRYSDSPVYTYTQYEQHVTDYSSTISETEGTVGADELSLPFAPETKVGKGQFYYTATELQAAGLSAGDITGLKLNLTDAGDDVNFLRIRIKSVDETSANTAAPELDGFTEVYFSNTAFQNTGEHFFKFYENFDWDGTSNLVVEFSYTNPPVGTPPAIFAHQTGFQSGLVYNGNEDNALEFSGTGSVATPDLSLTEITDEITIAFWSRGNANALPTATFAFEGEDFAGNRNAGAHLPWGNGIIFWDCGNEGNGWDRISRQATEAEYENEWAHWAFTKNSNTGVMRIFRNGESWHEANGRTNSINIEKFSIGANIENVTSYQGQLDAFQIFNKELDADAIKIWMHQLYDDSLPFAENLQAFYDFDEGMGQAANDVSPNGSVANIIGAPAWRSVRGKDLFKEFITTNVRPTATFVQGEYQVEDQVVFVLDSIENPQNRVVSYSVNGTDLIVLDTQFVWDVDASLVFDEAGNLIDFNDIQPDASVTLGEFDYYQKIPAKYEILSLVTPYGNGLDLGQEGVTFKIDVTDYAPILTGSKRMSLELGGQNQEEMDIKFLFIEGTPTREVKNIQNIWPFRRGVIDVILDDSAFEPRMVATSDEDDLQYKLRVAVTGHGQNGEFQPRNHFITAAGEQFNFDVWKECSELPIYPQGGTWLFDRAGWCPGLPTDVHEYDLTDLIQKGEPIRIDYGINGFTMTEANYLVSAQLVTYGPPAFEVDAEVVEIIRPTTQLEHARLNPACNEPMVRIKNNGQKALTSMLIEYGEVGGEKKTRQWFGNLGYLETEDVSLPIEFLGFWNELEGTGTFEVSVSDVNGGADEHASNNYISSTFERPQVFDRPIQVQVRTNNEGSETSYTIKDTEGNIILERGNLASNTTYTDQLQLPRGCYTFEINDTEDDGLFYWFWEQVGPPRGRGSARLLEVFSNGIALPVHTFEPEFGRSARIDFSIPAFVNTLEQGEIEFFSLYPNPASETINLDLKGFEGDEFQIEILDINGKLVKTQRTTIFNKEHLETIDISTLPAGMYLKKVKNSKKFWVEEFVKN